jgi:hypothetical protein
MTMGAGRRSWSGSSASEGSLSVGTDPGDTHDLHHHWRRSTDRHAGGTSTAPWQLRRAVSGGAVLQHVPPPSDAGAHDGAGTDAPAPSGAAPRRVRVESDSRWTHLLPPSAVQAPPPPSY